MNNVFVKMRALFLLQMKSGPADPHQAQQLKLSRLGAIPGMAPTSIAL
jgi:hypothetical protein